VGDAGSDRLSSAGSVIGRDADLEFIGLFLDRAATEGGALLMVGDAGVGKTLLLEVAAARAAAARGRARPGWSRASTR
jgi:MoxR-like ATPase